MMLQVPETVSVDDDRQVPISRPFQDGADTGHEGLAPPQPCQGADENPRCLKDSFTISFDLWSFSLSALWSEKSLKKTWKENYFRNN